MVRIKSSKEVAPSTLDLALRSFDKLTAREELGFHQLPLHDDVWDRAHDVGLRLRRQCGRLVVCGMGGSSLGARALIEALGDAATVDFLLSTDPDTVSGFFADEKRLRDSHFLVISKSGNTLEIAVFVAEIVRYLKRAGLSPRQNITVISELKLNPLTRWAEREGIAVIPHPMDVGGRFSVFSEVGLVPAVFAGVDIVNLRRGALCMRESSLAVCEIASLYSESFARDESISVFWFYMDRFEKLLPWLNQLWSESLGQKTSRDGKPAPAVSTPFSAMGTCDQHSVLQQFMDGARDKFILFLRAREHEAAGPVIENAIPEFSYLSGKRVGEVFASQSSATEEALREAGVQTASVTVEKTGAFAMGQLMMMFELVVGVLGEMLNMNVFEQPGVELGKKITKSKLESGSRV